jgi:hypothetical protein
VGYGRSAEREGSAREGESHEDAGIDEVLFDPTVPALDQVDRAADVVFG